jgi:hypothetical protein
VRRSGVETACFFSVSISVALVLPRVGSCAENFLDVGGERVTLDQLVPLLWIRSRTSMVHFATTNPSSLRRSGRRSSGHGTLVGGEVGSSEQRSSLRRGHRQSRDQGVGHFAVA